MGSTLSKSPDFKMPVERVCTHSQHHFHCGPEPKFHSPRPLSRQKRKRILKTVTSTRQMSISAGGDIAKRKKPNKLTDPISEEPPDLPSLTPSVLVVEEGDVDDSDDDDFSYNKDAMKVRKYSVDRNLQNFEREFEEVDSLLETNLIDTVDSQNEKENMRKFVRGKPFLSYIF